MRVIFYAEPLNIFQSQHLKKVPDAESVQARWVTNKQLEEMKTSGLLRFDELLDWSLWLEQGGLVQDLNFLGDRVPSQIVALKSFTVN
jgi:hypothetical protein